VTVAWLLDSYQAERHPVGAQVLALTDAFNRLVLGRSAVRRSVQALAVRCLLGFAPTRRGMANRLTGLGIRYPATMAGADRWVGRRVPDVDERGDRPYELLRAGRFLLLDGTGSSAVADAVRRSSLDVVVVRCAAGTPSGLPPAVLIRPDGYVAWASADTPAAPTSALAAAHWYTSDKTASAQIRPSSRPRATAS
jgi:hypothetical protein